MAAVRRLGVSGSRNGFTEHQLEAAKKFLAANPRIVEFHHGGCKGVDAEMHALVREMLPECRIVVHPPTYGGYRAEVKGDHEEPPLPFLTRNKKIVEAADLMICFPATREEKFRGSGTWATIREARRKKVRLRVVFPEAE